MGPAYFAQEYQCEFTDVGGAAFRLAAVEAAFEPEGQETFERWDLTPLSARI